MLGLGRDRTFVTPTLGSFFLRRSNTMDSTFAAVETHASVVVVNHGRVVNVVDIGHIHIGDGAVVVKMVAIPTSALVAATEISESVLMPP